VADWQVTATTIYCDAVDDDVTLMVDKDWNVQCTGYKKYLLNDEAAGKKLLRQKSRKTGRDLKCEGLPDYRVTGYRDKLKLQEEGGM
jgi:hypothetical protein